MLQLGTRLRVFWQTVITEVLFYAPVLRTYDTSCLTSSCSLQLADLRVWLLRCTVRRVKPCWLSSWHLPSGRLLSLLLIQWSGPIRAEVEWDERSVGRLKGAQAKRRMPSGNRPWLSKKQLIKRCISKYESVIILAAFFCLEKRGLDAFGFVWERDHFLQLPSFPHFFPLSRSSILILMSPSLSSEVSFV